MSAKQPKWTLIYNTHPIGSRWVGSAYEFFDTEVGAVNRYADLRAKGGVPPNVLITRPLISHVSAQSTFSTEKADGRPT
jgi:hypothetical protein